MGGYWYVGCVGWSWFCDYGGCLGVLVGWIVCVWCVGGGIWNGVWVVVVVYCCLVGYSVYSGGVYIDWDGDGYGFGGDNWLWGCVGYELVVYGVVLVWCRCKVVV